MVRECSALTLSDSYVCHCERNVILIRIKVESPELMMTRKDVRPKGLWRMHPYVQLSNRNYHTRLPSSTGLQRPQEWHANISLRKMACLWLSVQPQTDNSTNSNHVAKDHYFTICTSFPQLLPLRTCPSSNLKFSQSLMCFVHMSHSPHDWLYLSKYLSLENPLLIVICVKTLSSCLLVKIRVHLIFVSILCTRLCLNNFP